MDKERSKEITSLVLAVAGNLYLAWLFVSAIFDPESSKNFTDNTVAVLWSGELVIICASSFIFEIKRVTAVLKMIGAPEESAYFVFLVGLVLSLLFFSGMAYSFTHSWLAVLVIAGSLFVKHFRIYAANRPPPTKLLLFFFFFWMIVPVVLGITTVAVPALLPQLFPSYVYRFSLYISNLIDNKELLLMLLWGMFYFTSVAIFEMVSFFRRKAV